MDKKLYEMTKDQIISKRGNLSLNVGKYTTQNHLKRDFIFYPSFNKEIPRLSKRDEDLIDKFRQ